MADPFNSGRALGDLLFGQRGTPGVYQDTLHKAYTAEQALFDARKARSNAIIEEGRQRNLAALEGNPALRGELGVTDGQLAVLLGGGGNASQLSGALGDFADQRYRSAAVGAALGDDWNAANANLLGVANGPVQLATIQGQNLINNQYREGGGGITTTDQGRAAMAADAARAEASRASAASSYASAASTRQRAAIAQGQFDLQRAGRWNPSGGAGGGAGGAGSDMKLTEGQGKDLVYYTRGREANHLLDTLGNNLTATGGTQGGRGVLDAFVRSLPGVGDSSMANSIVSSDRQQAEQAGQEFLSSILRKDTGAAITAQEFDIYGRMYLPQPGDSPGTLRQKERARETALTAIRAGMGRAAAAIPEFRGTPAAGRATLGDAPPAGGRTVIRRGTLNGRPVVQYSDGTTDYAN